MRIGAVGAIEVGAEPGDGGSPPSGSCERVRAFASAATTLVALHRFRVLGLTRLELDDAIGSG